MKPSVCEDDRDTLDQRVLALTRAAVQACEDGRWDDVTALYDERGRMCSLEHVSPRVARQLVEYDRLVQARALVVQRAIRVDLERLAAQRRDLFRLKRSWTQSAPSSSRIAQSV